MLGVSSGLLPVQPPKDIALKQHPGGRTLTTLLFQTVSSVPKFGDGCYNASIVAHTLLKQISSIDCTLLL